PSVAQRNAEPPFVLAVDVGTTSVRAELFDRWARAIRGTGFAAECPVETTADGGAQIDPEALFDLTVGVIDQAVKAASKGLGEGLSIDGVAISTFWHSALGVDEQDRPTTPLLLCADSRGRDQMP